MDRALDLLAGAGLASALVFAPLAFGAVHRWAQAILEGLIFVVALGYVLRGIGVPRFRPADPAPDASRLAMVAAVLFPAWLLIQVLPLPPSALAVLSPGTYRLLVQTLPGWPAGPGYAAARLPDVPAWVPLWRPLALSPFLARDALIRMLTLGLAFLVVAHYPWRDPVRATRRLGAVLVAVAALEAAYALYQAMTGSDMIFWYHKPVDASLPSGTYVNRNHLAGLLEMALPVAGAFALESGARLAAMHRRRLRGSSLFQRAQAFVDVLATPLALRLIAQAGLILLLFVGLYRTQSRAGLLAPLASAFLLAPLFALGDRTARTQPAGPGRRSVPSARGKVPLRDGAPLRTGFARSRAGTPTGRLLPWKSRWLGSSAAVVGFLLLLSSLNLPLISPRFSDVQLTAGAAGRADTVSDAMRIVRDFPLFGVGLDGFQYIFPVYRSYGGGLLTHAHNDYVELAVEAGGPALVLALLLIAILYARAVSSFRKPREARTLLWGFLAAVTALLIHSFVDFNLHIPANALVFALLLGGVARLSRNPELRVASPRRASLLAIAAVLCVVAAVHWPLMRADLEFRRLVPDSTLRDSRPIATATAPVPAAALTRLAAAAPEHPFIQNEAGRALVRQLREGEPKGDQSLALRQAAHYFAAAARGIPPWAEAHLSLGLSAATGATGLTLADVQDALSRAQRLDPSDRDTSRVIARARRALLRGNGT
jgi:hypothetical protein